MIVLLALALGCGDGQKVATTASVKLTMRFDGGGSGSVASDPPGLTCAQGTCSGQFTVGSTVTLTATPGTARWVRWQGDCAGSLPSCKVAVAADRQVAATFAGANYVFVTSTSYAASAVAPDAADKECNALASAAGLPGHYVAWLSTSTQDARDRLGAARGWVRTDGLPFADSIASLTKKDQVFYPIHLDETGIPALGGAVFTGTADSGTLSPYGYDCSDWTTSSSSESVVIGDHTGGPHTWTDAGGTDCSVQGRLYCFGDDLTQPIGIDGLAPLLLVSRLAFVTAALWDGGGGVGALDAMCAADATAAGLPGTFKAAVATTQASAVSRFNLDGARWVRPDGVAIVAAARDLGNGMPLLAPIALHADGTVVSASTFVAWAGASSLTDAGTADSTCSDWTDNTAGSKGSIGEIGSGEQWFVAGIARFTCDKRLPVYCLQQ
jgi:hypothetical protein